MTVLLACWLADLAKRRTVAVCVFTVKLVAPFGRDGESDPSERNQGKDKGPSSTVVRRATAPAPARPRSRTYAIKA